MDDKPLVEMIGLIQEHTSIVGKSGLRSPFDIEANQFKEFAILDSQKDDLHGRVNALSNIKRALECRIDEILFNLCLYKKKEEEKWNFPKKIQVLTELDIIAPRILTKINRQRNLLEHAYINPSKDDIEDALDVTILFFGYTYRFMKSITEIGLDKKWNCVFDRENDRLEVTINGIDKIITINSSDQWLDFAKEIVAPLTIT
jgi:hypothetical protein